MKDYTIIPEPQICLHKGKTGLDVTWDNGLSSLTIAKRIFDNLNKTEEIFGFELIFSEIEELWLSTGDMLKTQFDYEEGYVLKIKKGKVHIGADTEKGKYYAIQTLSQIMATIKGSYVPELDIVDWPNLKMRGFHLCYHIISENMPYLAPNFDMAVQMIEEFAHFKLNTVLLELEAIFPYEKYLQLSNKLAFTPEQIEELRNICEKNHIAIMPLAQSLGHVYFVLRHPEFAHLRELPNTTQQYCPCNEDVSEFYFELIDEIIEKFEKIQYFHIGGDESRRLAKCPVCKDKLNREGMDALYGDHMNKIGEYILNKGIKPVIWGDIMESYPEILHKLDKRIAVIYWNYDIVEWDRPYVMEQYLNQGREVFGGCGVKFGTHSDYMFLYKKAMRNISIMASECSRNGVTGVIATDWMKLAPTEVGIIATCYNAQVTWSSFSNQKEFCTRFSKVFFGTEIPELDEIFRLVSEFTIKKEENTNGHWSAPYSETSRGILIDRLDRFDVSGRSFAQTLIENTKQDNYYEVIVKLETAIERGEKAYNLTNKYIDNIGFRKRLFEIIRLAAATQLLKSRVGIALNNAVKLLKYPEAGDENKRAEMSGKLKGLIEEWYEVKELVYNSLLEGTFSEVLNNAMEYKFDEDVVKYMQEFTGLLESDQILQGLIDLKTY